MYIAIKLLLVGQPLVAPQSAVDTFPLSLPAAIELAHERNPTLRAEQAEAAAQAQAPLDASRAFLPSIAFAVQGVRTTDPVAVFGMKLRQENFAAQDLALDPLNRPDPYSGYASSVTVELPLFHPEGLFGFAAAQRASAARHAAAERAGGATTFQVTKAYRDAQLARQRFMTFADALAAARAHAAQGEALRTQGLVTGLDARRASIRASEIEANLVGARAEAENALSVLRSMLALPDSMPIALTDSLTGAWAFECTEAAPRCDVDQRGDLVALRLAGEASSAAVKSAWASNLPSVALFGSLGYHGRTSPFKAGSGDWTIGIGVSWKPFQGLAGAARVRRAQAERVAAASRREAAERQAELEIAVGTRTVQAAGEQLSVAEAAADEARRAVEQARLRYQTGTAPITELLDVQAAATAARLNVFTARHRLFIAQAALELAFGVHDR